MAGGGIKLDVLANVRDFQRGTDDVADALDDVADSLDDVVRDGERSGERLERSFAELATAARRSGDDAGDGLRKGFKRAEDGVQDFKQEANQSLRETAASVSSVEDGLDAVQEIAANALGGFGPAGAAAGLVAATGIGLATTALQGNQEAADETKRRFADMYSEAIEDGRTFLTESQILAESLRIINDPERQGEYNDAVNDAKVLNLDINDTIRARAGDEEKIALVREAAKRVSEEMNETMRDGVGINAAEYAELGNIAAKYDELKNLSDDRKDRAAASLELEKELNGEVAAGNAEAKKAIDERGKALQGYADLAASIPDPVLVPRIDDSGLRDIESRVRALDGRSIAIRVEGQTGPGRFIL